MRGVITIQGQMVEGIPLQSPGKLSIFPVLSLFFHLSIKILFSKLTRIDLLPHEVWSLEVENCGLRRHLKLEDFLLHFYNNWHKSTYWLNGCRGYHTKVVSLILTFWRPRKIDVTPHQV